MLGRLVKTVEEGVEWAKSIKAPAVFVVDLGHPSGLLSVSAGYYVKEGESYEGPSFFEFKGRPLGKLLHREIF